MDKSLNNNVKRFKTENIYGMFQTISKTAWNYVKPSELNQCAMGVTVWFVSKI